jgi:hypothetical protein
VVQALLHAPPTQAWPVWQRLAQLPQWVGSVETLTQAPLHVVAPALQAQAPAVHLAPEPHVLPQAPQAKGSVWRFTQALLQFDRPAAHTVVQAPREQTCAEVHWRLHAPQLEGSPCVSVHTPRQRAPPL